MKKLTPFLTLAMMFVLCACDSNAHKDLSPKSSGSYSPADNAEIDSFEIKESCLSLKEGEVYQLGTVIHPVLQKSPAIVYLSSNPDVVSVDPLNGKVTAKSCGFAVVTAIRGERESKSYISVSKDDTFDQGISNLQTISTAQQDISYFVPNYMRSVSYSDSTLKRNGTVMSHSTNYEETVVSIEDAYFMVRDRYYTKSPAEGANATYNGGMWLFYCNEEMHTLIFHEDAAGNRRFLDVDSGGLASRQAAVVECLGILFTNGSKAFSGGVETVSSYKETNDIINTLKSSESVIVDRDARGDEDGNAFASYTIEFNNELIDLSLSSNLGVPSNVYADIHRYNAFYYFENYCRYMQENMDITYSWRNNNYVSTSLYSKIFDFEEKPLYYPDLEAEGWTKGEDIFDI